MNRDSAAKIETIIRPDGRAVHRRYRCPDGVQEKV